MKWMIIMLVCLAACTKKPITAPRAIEEPKQAAALDQDETVIAFEHPIPFQSILFDLNSAVINEPGGVQELAAYLVRTMGTVTLSGHACPLGPERYNLDLSVRRAAEVERLLIAFGVPSGKIQTQGFGELRPVTKKKAFLALNRRVEINVAF